MKSCEDQMKASTWVLSAGLTAGFISGAFAQATVATTLPPAGTTKVCAPFVPKAWRTVTPVPGTWSLDDCRNMGQALGANSLQVGCFFEKALAGQTSKSVFGTVSTITNPPTSANLPNPNCGW
jgi:hypothetical protein